jgi:hypothetical protein
MAAPIFSPQYPPPKIGTWDLRPRVSDTRVSDPVFCAACICQPQLPTVGPTKDANKTKSFQNNTRCKNQNQDEKLFLNFEKKNEKFFRIFFIVSCIIYIYPSLFRVLFDLYAKYMLAFVLNTCGAKNTFGHPGVGHPRSQVPGPDFWRGVLGAENRGRHLDICRSCIFFDLGSGADSWPLVLLLKNTCGAKNTIGHPGVGHPRSQVPGPDFWRGVLGAENRGRHLDVCGSCIIFSGAVRVGLCALNTWS